MKTANNKGVLIVLFGATGDLAKRKIFPALYSMSEAGQLPKNTIILGIGRGHNVTDESFRQEAEDALHEFSEPSDQHAHWCKNCIYYHGMGRSGPAEYQSLVQRITKIEQDQKLSGNRMLYLAVPPTAFIPTITALGTAGLNKGKGWTRLVIEKPFGHDLESAIELNEISHKYFTEEQIYRIDHYLGKETVQNLLAFRFGNGIFESLWNRDKIERVEIRVAEELGIEQRAEYYEHAGALRDMVQNHLTQLLCLTSMGIPSAFKASDVRYEKIKVLRSITPIRANDVVFGQYTEGSVNGQGVRAYRKEEGVSPRSKTETFVAIKLNIENWRWHGVPFILRSGKRMRERSTDIVVTFHRPPISIFKPMRTSDLQPNQLVITIQPNEGFRVSFQVKKPGEGMVLEPEWMRFSYADAFGPLPDAYHTLLLDVIQGDQTLFVSAEESEASWQLYTPILERPHQLQFYPAGSWGPEVKF